MSQHKILSNVTYFVELLVYYTNDVISNLCIYTQEYYRNVMMNKFDHIQLIRLLRHAYLFS